MQATEWTGLKITLTKLPGTKSEKKLAGLGRARAKILYFISGRAALGPKFQFPFRAGPEIRPVQTSNVCVMNNIDDEEFTYPAKFLKKCKFHF